MSFLNWGNRNVQLANEVSPKWEPFGGVEKTSSLIGRCSNSKCQSAWLQLFRHRTRPVFEGGWTCSPQCTEAQVQLAVSRERNGWTQFQEKHRHRIPLGLLMLENGWVTSLQLRRAVEAQRDSGAGRIGEWLVRQGATDEAIVTRALSMQWGCPVLSLSGGMVGNSPLLPRLFVDKFGVVPIQGFSGRIVYLGFEQSLDRALAFSLERIEGKRVECGILRSSTFGNMQRTLHEQTFPAVQLAEATSEVAAAHIFARSIERALPVGSRLVRVREWLWLRMILEPGIAGEPKRPCLSDVLCRVGSF